MHVYMYVTFDNRDEYVICCVLGGELLLIGIGHGFRCYSAHLRTNICDHASCSLKKIVVPP